MERKNYLPIENPTTQHLLGLGLLTLGIKVACDRSIITCPSKDIFKSGKTVGIGSSGGAVASIPPGGVLTSYGADIKGGTKTIPTNGYTTSVQPGVKPLPVLTPKPPASANTAEMLALIEKLKKAKSEQEMASLLQSSPGTAILQTVLQNPALAQSLLQGGGALAGSLLQNLPQILTGAVGTVGNLLELPFNLISGLIPGGSSTPAPTTPAPASGGIFGGLFDWLPGVGGSTPATPAPAEEPGFFDWLTGGSTTPATPAPAEEPGFFDWLTGGSTTPATPAPAESSGSGSWWPF